jgi:DNA-binding winged helix-turn-helix (wHTH) protein/tetratricopeptide (TPR) repeat protein
VLLSPKVVDTLLVLVQSAGRVVSKEALIAAVWPDVVVVESGLTRNLSVLRKALEEREPDGAYIETIPRRGYRFVAAVTEELEPAEAPATFKPEPRRETSPDSAPRKSPFLRIAVPAAALLVIAVAATAVLVGRSPRTTAAEQKAVEPGVRIGEHLLFKLSPDEAIRASDQFRHAISASPNSAAAHAGLAIALLQTAALGVRQVSGIAAEAERAASRSLELDNSLATAHYASGLHSLLCRWNLVEAEKRFRRALELDPGSIQTRFGYTQLKFAQGDVSEAIRLSEEALRLDPASPLLGARYCQAFYYARDFRRAEAECRKVLDRERHYTLARYYLALTLGWLGHPDQAHEIIDSLGIPPAILDADRAWLSIRAGHRNPAMQALMSRRQLIREGRANASAKLLLAALLGINDEAFEAIEAGISSRAIEILTLGIDPRLDGIRGDKRYNQALRRIRPAPPPSKG